MKYYVFTVILTAVATLAFTAIVWRIGLRYRLYPEIRERDVHTTPKPRIGGVAMYLIDRYADRLRGSQAVSHDDAAGAPPVPVSG